MTQVGDAYIELHARFHEKNLVMESRRLARMFGKGYQQAIQDSIRKTDAQFHTHFNQHIKSFQALQKQRQKALSDNTKVLQSLERQRIREHEKLMEEAFREDARRTKQLDRMMEDAHNEDLKRIQQRELVRAAHAARADAAVQRHNALVESAFREDARRTKHLDGLMDAAHKEDMRRTREFLDSQKRVASETQRIFSENVSSAKLEQSYRDGGQKMGTAFATEMDKSFKDAVMRGLGPTIDVRTRNKLEHEHEVHAGRIGRLFADHLSRGFEAIMSLLPARLENLFTRTGPVMGTVFLAAFVGGVMIGVPAAGAMISGALFAAIGTGMAGLGIFLARSDPKVQAAAMKMWEGVETALTKSAQKSFSVPIIAALSLLEKAFGRWLPLIDRLFAASGSFVMPIARGLTGLIDGFIAPMTRLMESDFMRDLMNITSLGFGKIGEAVGRFFDRFLKDPKAMKGATLALEDMFSLLAGSIGFAGDILQKLSGIWASLNGQDGKRGIGKLQQMRDLWKDIRDLIGNVTDMLEPAVSGGKKRTALEGVAEDGKDFVQIFRQILGFLANPNDPGIKKWWKDQWADIKLETKTAWQTIRHDVSVGLNDIRIDFVEEGQIWIERWKATQAILKITWGAAWGQIKATAQAGWAGLSTIFIIGRDNLFRNFRFATTILQMIWATMWENVKRLTRSALTVLSVVITGALIGMRANITGVLNSIAAAWSRIWGGMRSALGGIWDGIQHAVKVGMQLVIDILNTGIKGINSVLGKLGVKFRVTQVPDLISKSRRGGGGNFASGGMVYGPGTGTSDSINARLSNGEFVVNAKETARHRQLLEAINAGAVGVPGFAAGGMAYPGIIALAKKSGIPNNPGSTLRPGDRVASGGYSHHAFGNAVDFMGFNQDALASFFMSLHTLEVIHHSLRTGRIYAKYNGRPGTLVPGHENHLHVAMSPAMVANPGGGGLAGIPGFGPIMQGWNFIKKTMIDPVIKKMMDALPGGTAPNMIIKGAGGKLANEVVSKAKAEIDAMIKQMTSFAGMNSPGNPDVGPSGPSRWAGTVATALKMLGLPTSWLGPTLTLIQRESGGNPNAINNWDSNAARGTPSKGLMQTIGPTFEANKYPGFNNIYGPLDNILAGLRYIRSRYGSIFNVQQAVGATPRGYDYGGYIPQGTSLIRNDSGRPELLLSHAQEEKMVGGANNCVYVTVQLGDEVILDKVAAVVDSNNNALVQEFRKGR